eukprot:1063284-Pyramimonas_sp.AAC.1
MRTALCGLCPGTPRNPPAHRWPPSLPGALALSCSAVRTFLSKTFLASRMACWAAPTNMGSSVADLSSWRT